MKINEVLTNANLRIVTLSLSEEFTETTPRQAITTTNLNHSEDVDYKTHLLEILLQNIDQLKTEKGYNDFVKATKKRITNHPDKYTLLTPKGLRSRKLTMDEFKLLCNVQKDIGLSNIGLFLTYSLHKKVDELITWVESKFGKDYYYVMDHNMRYDMFKKIYMDALNKKHPLVSFLGREPTKKNKENFVFIQERPTDSILRWISSLSKKTKFGAVKPTFYYFLGYDVASFNTRKGRYQVPQMELEVIDGFKYVSVDKCKHKNCHLVSGNTLGQTIEEYSKVKKDSIPCSVYSIIELNAEYEQYQKTKDVKILLQAIDSDVKKFNELALTSV